MAFSIDNSKKRLFLPLTTEAYNWYCEGKSVEIRKFQRRFKNILSQNYEIAELRKGYNGPSIWAEIKSIKKYNNVTDLLIDVNYKELIPSATTNIEAQNRLRSYVNNEKEIIAIFLNLIPIV